MTCRKRNRKRTETWRGSIAVQLRLSRRGFRPPVQYGVRSTVLVLQVHVLIPYPYWPDASVPSSVRVDWWMATRGSLHGGVRGSVRYLLVPNTLVPTPEYVLRTKYHNGGAVSVRRYVLASLTRIGTSAGTAPSPAHHFNSP